MRLPKLKLGDYVAIDFYDHHQFTGDQSSLPMRFEVVGRLVHETAIHYVLAVWHFTDGPKDANCDYYSIVKGAIKKVRKLK